MYVKSGIYLLCCLIIEVSSSNVHPKCRPVMLPMCSVGQSRDGDNDVVKWIYNSTTFPNFNNDANEQEVEISMSAIHPLISTSCSRFLELFLCSVFSPACTGNGVVPPCRSLCLKVKEDCEAVTQMFGIAWPPRLDCDNFPLQDDMTGNGNDAGDAILVNSIIWSEALLSDVCIPLSGDDVITPALSRGEEEENVTRYPADYEVRCPAHMRAPPDQPGYTFLGLDECAAPCPNMYLDPVELSIVRYIIIVLASLCVVVTSFVLFTFAIDTNRFRYPERPIVFYATSYLVISCIFIVGFILGPEVACNEQVTNEENKIEQGFVVTEGFHRRFCTVVFMVLYFFTVNGTIWWLILTVTWLLAAGLKWGSEAIEKYSHYYHGLAWGIPAIQTMIVITSGKIEGDNIAGVCFVGLYDSEGLRYLLLLPMSLYLIVGIIVLLTGFICLNRVRKSLDDEANQKNLAKFMLRIGVFSILYILPQVVLIAIYAIEDSNRKYWESAWFMVNCGNYGIPCPAEQHPVVILAEGNPHPGIIIFCLKYVMTLVVALPPLFWVASKKTVTSWQNFVTKPPCGNHGNKLNLTQTQLLNDSNGPHARDVKRKQQSDNDVIFGAFGKLWGSSASVAAAVTSPRARTQQELWDDVTSTLTSESESTLAKVLEFESRKNRGRRVVGRRRRKGDCASTEVAEICKVPIVGTNHKVPESIERNNRFDDAVKAKTVNGADDKAQVPDVVDKKVEVTSPCVPDIIKTSEPTSSLTRPNRPERNRKTPPVPPTRVDSARILEI
uniref:Uncharacterized protein n=1 Tax=Ciona savignyi TaxID=51511 RepID=H2YB71_CIOSA